MTAVTKEKPKPVVLPEFCKGCGRCIEACNKDCLHLSSDINPATGLLPVVVDLSHCNACGLCVDACPEPYGIFSTPSPTSEFGIEEVARMLGQTRRPTPAEQDLPSRRLPLSPSRPLNIKGTYAAAVGALLAGCRHVFGYPITPSTEGAELLAKLLPKIDGVFLQAGSEVATINHMYGCGGAGLPCLTFTSSPGLSLMLEGVSYMIGAELPGVIIDVMRSGPGLGNIGPAQADIKLACRGLGHGDSHAIALAPSTPQEMLDLTMLAFELSFKYRNPVLVLGDGYLGQMTGKVTLPDHIVQPGLPAWAVWGDAAHRGNLHTSIYLSEPDQEDHNRKILAKYRAMASEARAETFRCEDADVLIVACNTPARTAKGATQALRDSGIRAGLFRPITVWPFPVDALVPLLQRARLLVVAEASDGQLEDEMRLSLSHAGQALPRVVSVRHYGGILPQQSEIVAAVKGSVQS